MATISLDLRERILRVYDKGDTTRQAVAERFEVSLGMVKKLLQQRRRTGDLSARHCFSGRKPTITDAHKQEFKRLIDMQPDITLAELRDAVGLDCSLPAIHYALADMGLSYKKRRSEPQSKTAPTSSSGAKVGAKR